ncbi:MAG: 5-bromo-4-chloroindolyl phosphate hydrolysis family protein [Oscillospiraceae bacterium]|nr:5-bromo-4-chloroindolyl phosphate hydrolysis family protein [Oscillospiraceae bacterium]
MSEHYEYDSEKVPEKKTPSRSKRTQNDREWYRWPAIIILFATGLWPLALLLMLSGGKKNKQPHTANRTAAQEVMDQKRASERIFSEQRSKNQGSNGKIGKKPEKKNKKEQKVRGKALRIIGICLFVLGAILCIDGASSVLQGYDYALEDIFSGLGFLTGGGIMWGRGSYLAKMSRRTQRYILAIGAADSMRLSEIAKRVNRTPKQTAKELQKLIDKGFLGEDAYIDHERGYFVRFGAEIEEVKEEPVVPKEADEGYSGILRSLRLANDRIPDAELSAKIERLEQICALIFREVEEHPEKRSRIRKFFDYYLPTTQKLLDTYAEFDEMGVEGQNVAQTKARIAEMMDAIVEGFEHQLDQLYSADAMDVATDIKVMERMLHQDTASAAKDFGYEQEDQGENPDGIQLEL